MQDHLTVFDGSALVGSVYDTDPISFEYSPSWIASGGYQVASIELKGERNQSESVRAFFENLLPEGILRETLALQKKTSSVFALLREIAGDNSGNLVILPPGETPQANSYAPTTWAQIFNAPASNSGNAKNDPSGHRISLSGAQRKAAIHIDESGTPMIPLGTSPSMYIVKPDIVSIEGVWRSAANEALIMRAAKHCGLDVADVFYEPVSQSCVVKRFDRNQTSTGLVRLVQYDFCQISSIGSDKKYEAEGGPDIKACANLIRKHSSQPALDLKRFLQWVFFNLMTGNNDSHAKNLSFYQLPGKGLAMTPHYDLMCTRLYPGLSKKFAFAVGGVALPGDIGIKEVSALAESLNLKPAYLSKIAYDLYSDLQPALEKACADLNGSFGHSEKTLAEKLTQKVRSISNAFAKRMTPAQIETNTAALTEAPKG